MKYCFILLLCILSLSSCTRSKDSQFYVLNPLPLSSTKSASAVTSIGIDHIHMPAYAEKTQLVIYTAVNEVLVDEYHQWVETLDKNIQRVVQANLSLLLPGALIENWPWDIKFKPDYHLQLTLTQFSMSTKGICELRAQYQIYTADHIIKKREVAYHTKAATQAIEDLVSCMNRNLTHLTQDIALSLR